MFSRRSITVVKPMENKRRSTRGSSTNHEWEKPSGCRPWDEYSKHSSRGIVRPNYFVFSLVFRHRFVKKLLFWFTWTLLIVLIRESLRWVDFSVYFHRAMLDIPIWLLRCWFFWVIQFEMGLFRLIVSRLVYFSQNFEEKILIFHSPPRPRYRFRGTLQNHDDDSNGNVKKQYVFKMSKTTILHVHPAFLYISLPSLHNYDVK